MNKIVFTLLMLCFQLPFMMANDVTVNGSVLFSFTDPFPIGGYEVSLTVLEADAVNYTEVTDEEGNFTFQVNVDTSPDGVFALVRTYDPCTGEEIAEEIFLADEEEQVFSVVLILCSEINPPPPPSSCESFFGWEQTSSNPYLIQFNDLSFVDSQDGPDSWEWDFGDGTTSAEQNPLHEYDQTGDYDVTLIITFDTCESISVHPVHVTDFNFCNCDPEFDPVCVTGPDGTIITFINECEALCVGFENSDFTVCEGTGSCDCPEVYFPVCAVSAAGDTLNFDNPCFAECEGYEEADLIDCPGDGPCGCDDVFDPVCVFSENNILDFYPNPCYAICAGVDPADFLDCFGFNCHAYFEFNLIEETNTVEFIDLSDGISSPIVSWEWDFGDGSSSQESNPVYTYSESGIYNVILTITTAEGCTATFEQHVCIGEDCVANCDCPDVFDPVCVVTPDGEIITLPNPCFAICLGFGEDTFVDCEDDCICPGVFDPVCVATEGDLIEVFSNACFAECAGYTAEDFVDCGDDCICPDYLDPVCVVNPAGDTIQFNNPCFAECEGYGPDDYFSCEYVDPCGCYEIFAPVCVEVADGLIILFPNDCFAICEGFTEEDFVECEGDGFEGCYAGFDYEIIPGTNEVAFFDQSYSFTEEITEWEWFFGDDATSDEQNPVHEYAEDGIYDVTLRITTEDGCESSSTQHLCIGDGTIIDMPDCQAMFFFEQATDIPLTFQFVDMSFGEVDSWSWDFGDGNTSTEQNPVHTYQEEGTYLVALTISSEECQSTMYLLLFTDDSIWYSNECTALFLPVMVPDSNQVFFLNLSSVDAVSFEWDFGDGATSDEFFPVHQYSAGGTYEITLTITTADGCESTYSVTLNLETEGFTGNPTFLLLNSDEEAAVKAEDRLSVFPNPTKGELNIELETKVAASYQTQLFGLDGKLYQSQQRDLSTGVNNWQISTDELPAGMYLLRIQSETGTQTIKVVKQ